MKNLILENEKPVWERKEIRARVGKHLKGYLQYVSEKYPDKNGSQLITLLFKKEAKRIQIKNEQAKRNQESLIEQGL